MSTPDALTVHLADGRTERFTSDDPTQWAYGSYRAWYHQHRVDPDGSLIIERVDQAYDEDDGPWISGRREVARFRAGLWDYVRED